MSAIRAGTDRFKSTYEYGVKSPFVAHGIAAYERAFQTLECNSRRTQGPADSWF